MASEMDDRKIANIVREVIAAQLNAAGETTPGLVARIVCKDHPDVVASYGEQLAQSAISAKASGQLRSWFTISFAGEKQFGLPGISADVMAEIPPTITVPDGKNEPRHVLVSRVTLGEFRAWERMLDEQIKNDKRKHLAARFIVNKAKGLPDEMMLREAFGVSVAAE